jgi:hypothetical protein
VSQFLGIEQPRDPRSRNRRPRLGVSQVAPQTAIVFLEAPQPRVRVSQRSLRKMEAQRGFSPDRGRRMAVGQRRVACLTGGQGLRRRRCWCQRLRTRDRPLDGDRAWAAVHTDLWRHFAQEPAVRGRAIQPAGHRADLADQAVEKRRVVARKIAVERFQRGHDRAQLRVTPFDAGPAHGEDPSGPSEQ